jgi:arylsulfatase A-like enzyme
MSDNKKTEQPNIILITLDELRFPVHFPSGIDNVDAFFARFMPHTYRLLWKDGTKFLNHHIASCACTPSRGAIVTGLYSQQTYLMATRALPGLLMQAPFAPQPSLQPEFPTYGKLMRELKYQTPYVGKWHLSNSPSDPNSVTARLYLDEYGFDAQTVPDPIGLPGQGAGATPPSPGPRLGQPQSDASIASQAVAWLHQRAKESKNDQPFCLSVGLVNPHDQQFYWAGIEANIFNALYAEYDDGTEQPGVSYACSIIPESDPPQYGYSLPDNWESAERLQQTGPKLHRVGREFFAYNMTGDIADAPDADHFKLEPTQAAEGMHKAVAPHRYWVKALDTYTKLMQMVDEQIGQVVENIPKELRDNTVVIFTSDHGDYVGSHGMLGKSFALYKESLHVPLVIRDFTGKFTPSADLVRNQLTSHVDLLPLLVSLGQGGTGWMDDGDYAPLYGRRARLYDILQNPAFPGRKYALHATDEPTNVSWNYLNAPSHVVGLITDSGKLGAYSFWDAQTDGSTPLPQGQEVEYYDYKTPGGLAETHNTPDQPKAQELLKLLLTDLIPNELQAPLPAQYQQAQQTALQQYWTYVLNSDKQTITTGLIG